MSGCLEGRTCSTLLKTQYFKPFHWKQIIFLIASRPLGEKKSRSSSSSSLMAQTKHASTPPMQMRRYKLLTDFHIKAGECGNARFPAQKQKHQGLRIEKVRLVVFSGRLIVLSACAVFKARNKTSLARGCFPPARYQATLTQHRRSFHQDSDTKLHHYSISFIVWKPELVRIHSGKRYAHTVYCRHFST